MDYRTVPPPRWGTATPEEWAREADYARGMLRTATHYAPELVEMFRAWAAAWEARKNTYDKAHAVAVKEAVTSVRLMSHGLRDEAERAYALAMDACKMEREAMALFYPCFLETIPNHER